MANVKSERIQRTEDYGSQVTDHLSEPRVGNVFEQQPDDGFKEDIVPTGQRASQAVTVDKLLYQRECRCRGHVLS
jgi:hypothetical protein